LLTVVENTPNDKNKMIELFKKLQDYGKPPEGIATNFDSF
jgi:hypothetical protein